MYQEEHGRSPGICEWLSRLQLHSRESFTNFSAVDTQNPATMVIQYFRANNILIAPVSLSWGHMDPSFPG